MPTEFPQLRHENKRSTCQCCWGWEIANHRQGCWWQKMSIYNKYGHKNYWADRYLLICPSFDHLCLTMLGHKPDVTKIVFSGKNLKKGMATISVGFWEKLIISIHDALLPKIWFTLSIEKCLKGWWLKFEVCGWILSQSFKLSKATGGSASYRGGVHSLKGNGHSRTLYFHSFWL